MDMCVHTYVCIQICSYTINCDVWVYFVSLKKSLQNYGSTNMVGLKSKYLLQSRQPAVKVWSLALSYKSIFNFVAIFYRLKRLTSTLQIIVYSDLDTTLNCICFVGLGSMEYPFIAITPILIWNGSTFASPIYEGGCFHSIETHVLDC